MNILKNFKENHNNSLIFVIILAFILTLSIVYINSTDNILGRFHRDIYLYLIEALMFNGYSFDTYSYISILSPLIPFLTSLAFRLGFVSEIPIFIITGVFFFSSIIGMYYLLRLRFNDLYSLCGVALFCSLTVIMRWAGNGSIDIPSVCLWIWGMYFFIKAMDTKQKYFYLSIPLLVLSVFAKYITLITIPLVFVYFISRGNFFNNLKKYIKNIIGGLILGLVCTIPIIYFYITRNAMSLVSSYGESVSNTGSSVHEVNDFLFYLFNLNKIIFRYNDFVGLIHIIILVVGIVFSLLTVYKILKYYKTRNIFKVLKGRLNYIGVILSIIGFILSFLITRDFSNTICVLLFYIFACIFAVCFNNIINEYNKSDDKYTSFSFDFMMFVWFMSQFIFLSAFLVKTYRYGIAFTPPLVFFIVYGFSKICENIPKEYSIKKYLPYIFITVLLIVSFGHLSVNGHDSWVDDEKYIANWMEENWDLDKLNIWSDRPVYAWYFQKDYHYIDNRGDVNNLSQDMINANVDYYISHEPNLVIPNFTKVKEYNSISFFKRD